MAVVGAQGAEYVESDEMLLRVCSDKELSLAKVVEAAACDAASGTYTDDQGRLALHHVCAHAMCTAEILAATPGDRFAKDISGDAPVDLLCRNPAATAAAHESCLAGRDDRVAADYGSLLHYWALCACATPHLLAAAAARSPADRDARGLTPLHCLCSNRCVSAPLLAGLFVLEDAAAWALAGDAEGWTPLHYLCANAGAPPAAVAALAAFAPAAALATDDEEGMAPAHALALSDALCGVDYVDALVESAGDGALRVADGAGRRPAYYAAKRGPGAAAAFDADGADGRRRRRELRDDGFTVVRVGERAAADLARETSAVLDHCLAAPDLDVFGTIRTPNNRYDVKAALTPKLRAVLADLAADLPWLAAAPVTQLSAVHSDPGAPLQTPHSDTCFIRDDAPRLYTALVALTPVSQERGPTAVWPGTHGADFHALSDADRLARLRDGRQLAICPLKPGEGILFDARLFHRGGRNATAADRRSLLSVSLQAGGGDAASPAAHAGTTDSIFAAYRDKYRLGDFAAAEA